MDDVVSKDALNNAGSGKSGRRKRSWYKRRQRTRRTLMAVAAGMLIAAAFLLNAAHHFAPSSLRASRILSGSFWARTDFHEDPAFAALHPAKAARYRSRIAGVYPYSVVPRRREECQ